MLEAELGLGETVEHHLLRIFRHKHHVLPIYSLHMHTYL